jgi:hypothetical protein
MVIEDALFDESMKPVLPYAGTSGWSGSSTSRARAVRDDESGETSWRQSAALWALYESGTRGLTWKELGEKMGWHHGKASSVLSVLHQGGRIARLTEVRDRCKVYTHGEYVDGREVESHGRKPKPCPNCGWEGEG